MAAITTVCASNWSRKYFHLRFHGSFRSVWMRDWPWYSLAEESVSMASACRLSISPPLYGVDDSMPASASLRRCDASLLRCL